MALAIVSEKQIKLARSCWRQIARRRASLSRPKHSGRRSYSAIQLPAA